MQGTVTKHKLRSGRTSWGYYFQLAGKNEAGKRNQVTKQGFPTKREAEEALRVAIEDANRLVPSSADDNSFQSFFGMWMKEHAGRRCAPKTLERYQQLSEYAIRLFGNTPLRDLSPLTIQRSLNEIQDHGGKKSPAHPEGRPLSAKTVRHIGFLVSDALEAAVRWDLLAVNPMAKVQLPVLVKRDVTVLDETKIAKFLETAHGTRLYPFIVVAAATGARRGELLALQWPDVDLEAGALSISKSLEETESGLRVKGTKSGKPRRFSLPDFAVSVLKELKTEQDRHKSMYEKSYEDNGLVFCRLDGAYLKPKKTTARVTALARKSGFPKGVTLHVLRHSHASQLLSSGAPLPVVSKRLGHASPAITLSIYSHALEADEVVAAKLWNDAMAGVIEEDRKRSLGKSRTKAEKSA